MRLLWTDSDQLILRYGLEESKSDRRDLTTKPRIGLTANAWFKVSWEPFHEKTSANQRQTPLIKKARWALHDRAKFKTLVDNLRNLIDALLAVTKTPGTAEQRYQLMQEEIRSIQDTTVLSLLADNASEVDRGWSEAASDALEASILGEEERVSMCNWLERVDSNRVPTSPLTNEERETSMALSQKVKCLGLCGSLKIILEHLLEEPIPWKMMSRENSLQKIREEARDLLSLLEYTTVALSGTIEHDPRSRNIHHLSMVLSKATIVYRQILVKV